MILLQTKRGSDKHSDFLERISENDSVAEFEKMSGEELQIHLFIRDADPQMSRIATEVLEKDKPTMHQLKLKSRKLNQPSGITNEKNMAKWQM